MPAVKWGHSRRAQNRIAQAHRTDALPATSRRIATLQHSIRQGHGRHLHLVLIANPETRIRHATQAAKADSTKRKKMVPPERLELPTY